MPECFEKHWIVADILNTCPETIVVFLRYRMNCVGCSLAGFETLGDALQIYGIPLNVFLEELDNACYKEN